MLDQTTRQTILTLRVAGLRSPTARPATARNPHPIAWANGAAAVDTVVTPVYGSAMKGVVLALALLCCCYATASTEQLVRRASFDLDCASKELGYERIDNSTLGVRGCGKQATYVESCDGPRAKPETTCTWVLNGSISIPATPTGAATHATAVTTSPRAPTAPSTAPSAFAGAPAGALGREGEWWCTDASEPPLGHCDRQRADCERMRAELSPGSNIRWTECYARSVVYCYQTELSGRMLLRMCSATEEMCRYGHDHSDNGPSPVSGCERTP
jgi:hypothetical protein